MSQQFPEVVLEVNHLTTKLQLGRQIYNAVDDLSFTLKKGKTLAIVGESGSGKSMTAFSLMRITPNPPVVSIEGEVWYRGDNLLLLPEEKMRQLRGSKLAMIFQDPMSALNPVYTIGDQLMEVAKWHLDATEEEAFERALQRLKEVGIPKAEERMFAYPHQLSGGMKQRAMIAMALMAEPEILIADEPTTALDVTIQAQVLELMRELQKKRGMALLLITHDMGVVAEMADEVTVMYASKGVEDGSVWDLFDHMAHPYTQGLFESRACMETPRGMLKAIPGKVPALGQFPGGCSFHPRCPYVMQKCRSGDVPNFQLKENHRAACWLHETNVT